MQEFPLMAKWVSRKFASVAVFYVFLSQLKGPAFAKIVAASVVTSIYLVTNVYQNTRQNPSKSGGQ